MIHPYPRLSAAIAVFFSTLCGGANSSQAPTTAAQPPFVLEEATIANIHAAFVSKTLTCQQLVESYIARIEAYDDAGPSLNAILTLNPSALNIAANMDTRRASDPTGMEPLHCIPVILKDNYDTASLPTTGGSVVLAESIPLDDAFVVERLVAAGPTLGAHYPLPT